MTFWEKFYSLCIKSGTKPNSVAKELGFSSAVCTQWKKGLQKPSAEKIAKIASYFNVTIDYLLGKETLDQQLEGIDFALQSETEDLTEEQKQSVLDFVQFIKNKDKK